MKKRFTSILFVLFMALIMLTMTVMADTGTATQAHGRLADGGYYIYCLSGRYVTVDTYPSLRSVQLTFPDTALKVFYVENKGNNQITLKVENPYSSTGYSYVGIEDSIKSGVALKLVDSPYLWNTYAESNTALTFSLRPSTNTKMIANASGESNAPRTKIILWTHSSMNAPKHGEFRFEPVAVSAKTPVATDYAFGNLTQTEGSVTPVMIETSSSNSSGAITVLYNDSTTLPTTAGSYRVTFNVAAAPPAWNEAKGLNGGTLVIAPKPSTAAPVGQMITMGGINWRVLDVQDGKALVVSELILEEREFQKDTTLLNGWANSSIRTYLNGDFYNKTFNENEKNRIVATTLMNNINPKYSMISEANSTDKIFLLSAEEVERYFADDGARIAYADRRTPTMENAAVNSTLVNPYEGVYQYYSPWYWWLRTPSDPAEGSRNGLYVTPYEEIKSQDIDKEFGVRPAMWIKLEGDGFKPYQPLKFNVEPEFFTMENMVLAIAQDIIYEYTGDWVFRFGYGARGPGVIKTETTVGEKGAMPPGYKHWFLVFRMRCWGALSLDNFDPFAEVTYGQFKDYLMKTMAWNQSQAENPHFKLTEEILAIAEKKAGISNTSANAKPVKAEIERLSKEIIYWLKAANASNSDVRILEYPIKREYKVGEGFDTTGILVVTGPYGKETNVNGNLTFTTSGVTLTQGRPFQTAGQKSIEVSYKGKKLLTYPVTVKK